MFFGSGRWKSDSVFSMDFSDYGVHARMPEFEAWMVVQASLRSSRCPCPSSPILNLIILSIVCLHLPDPEPEVKRTVNWSTDG